MPPQPVGFHYKACWKPREVVTIYEIDTSGQRNWAQAVYNFGWTPQTDLFGVVHKTIDYPASRSTIRLSRDHGVLKNGAYRSVRISARWEWRRRKRMSSTDLCRAISAATWTIGAWARAPPAVLSRPACRAPCSRLATSHASQGDSEMCGTAIECSLTGILCFVLHKKDALTGSLAGLDYPLLGKPVVGGFCTASAGANYLEELGPTAQQEIYKKSSIDLPVSRRFPQDAHVPDDHQGLSEDEAIRSASRSRSTGWSTRWSTATGAFTPSSSMPVRGRVGLSLAAARGQRANPATTSPRRREISAPAVTRALIVGSSFSAGSLHAQAHAVRRRRERPGDDGLDIASPRLPDAFQP